MTNHAGSDAVTIRDIPIGRIMKSGDNRPLDERKVAELAASIKEVGLINPICVRETAMTKDFFQIIAGHHRHAAFASLDRETVPCIVVEMDNLHAELAEIDENLIRHAYTPSQEARAVARRKAIVEELHPETRAGVAGAHASNRAQGNAAANLAVASFAEATAAATGKPVRSIRRAAARGKALGDDAVAITGTSLDSGVEIDALVILPAVERAKAGEKVSARTTNNRDQLSRSDLQLEADVASRAFVRIDPKMPRAAKAEYLDLFRKELERVEGEHLKQEGRQPSSRELELWIFQWHSLAWADVLV